MHILFPRLFFSLLVALGVAIHAALGGSGPGLCFLAFWASAQAVFLYTVLWDLAEAMMVPGRDGVPL